MAITNGSAINGPLPKNFKMVTTAGGLTIALSEQNLYTLKHLGVDEAENADTATIYMTLAKEKDTADAPVAASKLTAGQLRIASGEEITIGPGASSIKLIVGSGAPALRVIPKMLGA